MHVLTRHCRRGMDSMGVSRGYESRGSCSPRLELSLQPQGAAQLRKPNELLAACLTPRVGLSALMRWLVSFPVCISNVNELSAFFQSFNRHFISSSMDVSEAVPGAGERIIKRVSPRVHSTVGGDWHVNAPTPFSEEIAWNPINSVSSFYITHFLVCF